LRRSPLPPSPTFWPFTPSFATSRSTRTVESAAPGVLNDFRKAFRNDLTTNIEARALAGLCSPGQSLFLAAISGQKHGKPLFSVDAKQQNAPERSRPIMPLALRGKSAMAGAGLSIAKPEMHYELKLREKPENVEFNPLEGLLCELEVKKRSCESGARAMAGIAWPR
jgi:hypothetical protein